MNRVKKYKIATSNVEFPPFPPFELFVFTHRLNSRVWDRKGKAESVVFVHNNWLCTHIDLKIDVGAGGLFFIEMECLFFKCLNMSMFASTLRCYFEPSNKTISTNIFRILTPIENTQIGICSDEFAILREKAHFFPYFRITHHILSMCMKPFSASFGMLKIIFKCKVDKLFDGRLIVNMCYG